MEKRIIQGREVSDEQVQVWADEAEAGCDVVELEKRWGRPPRAESASRVVPTRFSEAELAELMERAECEGSFLIASTELMASVRSHASTASSR